MSQGQPPWSDEPITRPTEPFRAPPPPPPPLMAGHYRLGDMLGEGGMGAVYRAYDPECDRPLAVKVLTASLEYQPLARVRFLAEAKLMARLQHPGVPPVHAIGQLENGSPFFAMKLIQGQTLAQLLRGRPSPSHDRARWLGLFRSVCETVAYAHDQGILHRDLKPGNVMIGAFGEVQVMDWGLAGRVGQPLDIEGDETPTAEAETFKTRLTAAGVAMGTPDYIAPEQARGEWDLVDARADVFSLGAILCEILTGRPPYSGEGASQRLERAARADLAEAHSRLEGCGADPGLVALATRCLEALPRNRPASAGAIAEALAAHEAGVEARLRRAELERAAAEGRALSERRARRLAVGLGLAGVLLAVVALGSWAVWRQVSRAKEARVAAKQEQLAAALSRVKERFRAGDRTAARLALSEALGLAGDPEVGPGPSAEAREVERLFRVVDGMDYARLKRCGMPNCQFNYKDADPALPFRECGVDVFHASIDVPARRVAECELIREELIAGLDSWAWVLKTSGNPRGTDWGRLFDLADRCDDSAPRRKLRAALRRPAAEHLPELGRLAADPAMQAERTAVLVMLAEAFLKSGDVAQGVKVLQAALARHPGDFWLNVKLAELLSIDSKPSRFAEATPYWRAALALRPDNYLIQQNFIAQLANLKQFDQALAQGQRLVANAASPREKAHAYHILGQISLDPDNKPGGDIAAARRYCEEAMKADPEFAPPYINLGGILARSNDLAGAIGMWKRAAELEPGDHLSRYNLALITLALRRNEESKRYFDEAEKIKPQAGVYLSAGEMLASQGRPDEAVAHLNRCVKLSPTSGEAWLLLGKSHLRLQQFERARDALQEAAKHLPPDSPSRAELLEARAACDERLKPKGK